MKQLEKQQPDTLIGQYVKAMDDFRSGKQWEFDSLPGWDVRPQPPYFDFQVPILMILFYDAYILIQFCIGVTYCGS